MPGAESEVSPCDKCNKRLATQKMLEKHLKTFHSSLGNGEEAVWKYSCQVCQKRFYKKSNLQSHEISHSKQKTILCTLCSKTFKRMRALKVHHESVHNKSDECQGQIPNNSKTFLCTSCGKQFQTSTGLRLHTATHTGVEYIQKKYTCSFNEDCKKSFKSEADLKSHQVVHTKEKPFHCHECPAAFAQKSSLQDHLNVHRKTFQCEKCKSCFSRDRYLRAHNCGPSSAVQSISE